MKEFRCEVCGLVTTNPTRWFVIRCRDSDLTVYQWNSETANVPGARHYCGEAHAEL
jgi:Zinc finger, ZZ type